MNIISQVISEARWIKRAVILEKNQIRQIFNKRKEAIDKAVDKDDFDVATKEFNGLSDDLYPTLNAIANIQIVRKDEQRKLKNLKGLAKGISGLLNKRRTENISEVSNKYFFQIFLERIEDYLNSLLRIYSRISEYENVEKKFQHNKFTIVNDYGYRNEEYSDVLKILDSASDALSKANFDSLIYGDVVLTVDRQNIFAGRYDNKGDLIFLNVEARHVFNSVYTMVHEFGHRQWHKKLSDLKKEEYINDFNVSAGAISLDDRNDMWDALVKAQFKPGMAVKYLKNQELGKELIARWNDRVVKNGFRSKDVLSQGIRDSIKIMFVGKKMWELPTIQKQISVTDYGDGKVTEDFAEIFAHYVLNMSIKPDAFKRFQKTL